MFHTVLKGILHSKWRKHVLKLTLETMWKHTGLWLQTFTWTHERECDNWLEVMPYNIFLPQTYGFVLSYKTYYFLQLGSYRLLSCLFCVIFEMSTLRVYLLTLTLHGLTEMDFFFFKAVCVPQKKKKITHADMESEQMMTEFSYLSKLSRYDCPQI